MAKTAHTILIVSGLLGLTACNSPWMSQETRFYMQRNWQQATNFPWLQKMKDMASIDQIAPSPKLQEQTAYNKICLNPKGRQRVVTQDGVSDKSEYRRCLMDPYPATGMRMKNRPESQSGPQT